MYVMYIFKMAPDIDGAGNFDYSMAPMGTNGAYSSVDT